MVENEYKIIFLLKHGFLLFQIRFSTKFFFQSFACIICVLFHPNSLLYQTFFKKILLASSKQFLKKISNSTGASETFFWKKVQEKKFSFRRLFWNFCPSKFASWPNFFILIFFLQILTKNEILSEKRHFRRNIS